MDRQRAIDILEEVKVLDDSMYQYNDEYMKALDFAINDMKSLNREEKSGGVDCSWVEPL